MAARSSTPDGIVEARLGEITARFSERLSPEHKEQIRKRIERSVSIATAMRGAALTNSDEPEIVFAPFRGES